MREEWEAVAGDEHARISLQTDAHQLSLTVPQRRVEFSKALSLAVSIGPPLLAVLGLGLLGAFASELSLDLLAVVLGSVVAALIALAPGALAMWAHQLVERQIVMDVGGVQWAGGRIGWGEILGYELVDPRDDLPDGWWLRRSALGDESDPRADRVCQVRLVTRRDPITVARELTRVEAEAIGATLMHAMPTAFDDDDTEGLAQLRRAMSRQRLS